MCAVAALCCSAVRGQLPPAEAQRMLDQARDVLSAIPDPVSDGISVEDSEGLPAASVEDVWSGFVTISDATFDDVLGNGVWLVYV